MSANNGVRIDPTETLLSEVTFDHLSDVEKKVLLDVGFETVRIIMETSDPLARRNAELHLAKHYLEQGA